MLRQGKLLLPQQLETAIAVNGSLKKVHHRFGRFWTLESATLFQLWECIANHLLINKIHFVSKTTFCLNKSEILLSKYLLL